MFGEDKVWEVCEHPVVLECAIDNSQESARGGDDSLARALSCFDSFVKVFQVGTVTSGDQRALDQRGSGGTLRCSILFLGLRWFCHQSSLG